MVFLPLSFRAGLLLLELLLDVLEFAFEPEEGGLSTFPVLLLAGVDEVVEEAGVKIGSGLVVDGGMYNPPALGLEPLSPAFLINSIPLLVSRT